MKIIDGKTISLNIKNNLKQETEELKSKGITPGLAVILVGDDPASEIYVRNKKRACEFCGIKNIQYNLSENTTEEELLDLIKKLNLDNNVNGILVQLPLPKHINEKKITEAISPEKDVDGFCAVNIGNLVTGHNGFIPCTPAGVMELIYSTGVEISGKHAVIVGRSNIVGKPQAALLLRENATVTICHSRTKNLEKFTRNADILVAAVGKAKFITGDMIKENAIVIDVGMNRDENGKLCGDVDFETAKNVAGYITPVPGGVGPMTITMLMKNTLKAAKMQNKI